MNCCWSLIGGAGYGMRPPTLTELYAYGPFIGSLQPGLTYVEGDPLLRPERHRVTADVHAVLGVAGLEVELTRRLRGLLEHEVGVQEDRAVLHALSGLAEQVERAVVHELDTDLGHQPTPALVEGRHRVLGQHLVAGHPVAEHRASCLTS